MKTCMIYSLNFKNNQKLNKWVTFAKFVMNLSKTILNNNLSLNVNIGFIHIVLYLYGIKDLIIKIHLNVLYVVNLIYNKP